MSQTKSSYTQVMPVIECSDLDQLRLIMDKCGVVRAVTYNKLGSLGGWGLNWKKADPLIRAIIPPEQLGIPSKIFEWSVSDCFKAIAAQQEAAKTFLIKKIYRKTNDKEERKRLIQLLKENPTQDNWLHRQFRQQYLKGHTYQRHQTVYQKQGYRGTRLTRNRIKLEIQGRERGKRITLIISSQRLPLGQIRIIEVSGKLTVHTAFSRPRPTPVKPVNKLGLDKGYTEGFYLSNGKKVADGLGELLTAKTEKITKKNRNRARLYAHAKNHQNPTSSENIKRCNLVRKTENKKRSKEKAQIKQLIRTDLRKVLREPTQIFVEDLSQPIKNKTISKRINRRLNSWVKGELQVSVEEIAKETGSTVTTVNPSYTSQVDCQNGTLLGVRHGDRFIRYTGDVLQADQNAALTILARGTDSEITRWMNHHQVRAVLLHRTVRYLYSKGYSVADAVEKSWLNSKYKSEALAVESEYLRQGLSERLSTIEGASAQSVKTSVDDNSNFTHA